MTAAGNPGNASTFGYDALDRLTRHQRPGASQTYAYDAVGNRTHSGDGATLTPLSYDPASNRLTQVASRPIQSDANGSIVNDGVHQFGYDARGRMVSATTAAGTVRYQLNGLGQRVLKVAPSGSTVFHYDLDGRLIAETRGQVVTEYVYLNDMPVAVLR